MGKTLSRSGAQVQGIENVRSPSPVSATRHAELLSHLRGRHRGIGSSAIQLLGQESVLGGAKIEKHAFAVGGILAEGALVILDRK